MYFTTIVLQTMLKKAKTPEEKKMILLFVDKKIKDVSK